MNRFLSSWAHVVLIFLAAAGCFVFACGITTSEPEPEHASEPVVDPDATTREVARECLGLLKMCDDWEPRIGEIQHLPLPGYEDMEDPNCEEWPHRCNLSLPSAPVDAPCKVKFEGCVELVRATTPEIHNHHKK